MPRGILAAGLLALLCVVGMAVFQPALKAASPPVDRRDLSPGVIYVDTVEGRLFARPSKGDERVPLRAGAQIRGALVLETDPYSSAVLLFSNGTSIRMDESTRLRIEGFLQQPHDVSPDAYQMLTRDPATSYASIYLEHGSILGHAEKLMPKSFLYVQTPQLYADIRGTIFTFEHAEGDTRSKVGVYEGQVAVVAKTALSQTQRNNLTRAVTDVQTDLTPLYNSISPGSTLTINSQNYITMVMDHVTANEAAWFQGVIGSFAEKTGIQQGALEAGLANAYGGMPQSDGTPARLTTVQSSTIKTNLGPGYKFVIRTQDDGSLSDGSANTEAGAPFWYDSTEEVIGVEVKNDDGSITTITQKSTTVRFNGGTTTYTTQITETMQPDGSYTSTATETSSTTFDDGSTQGQTYTATTTGAADGTAVKEATSTYTENGAQIFVTEETVTTTYNDNNKLQRTVSRTINGTPQPGSPFVDPVTNFATITFSSNPDNKVLFSSTSFDENGQATGAATTATITYSEDGNSGTVITTDEDGNVTTETFEESFSTNDKGEQTRDFTKETETNDPIAVPYVVKEDLSITDLDNGGSIRTLTQTYSDGSIQITTIKLERFDDGGTRTTTTVTDGSGIDLQPAIQVTVYTEPDGTIVTETITDSNGNGQFDDGDTKTITRRNPGSVDDGTGTGGGGDDDDIDDGVDDAEDNIDDEVVSS